MRNTTDPLSNRCNAGRTRFGKPAGLSNIANFACAQRLV